MENQNYDKTRAYVVEFWNDNGGRVSVWW
jgi:hypothetical protein